MSDIKKILQGAKESYDSVVKENSELKKFIENNKSKGTNSIRNSNNRNISIRKQNTLGKNNQQNIKK